MKQLKLILKKNDKEIINRVTQYQTKLDEIMFFINDEKYVYKNNIFSKETEEELITFDFQEKNCKIFLKNYNYELNLNLFVKYINMTEKNIEINYHIESEDEIENIVKIEYL